MSPFALLVLILVDVHALSLRKQLFDLNQKNISLKNDLILMAMKFNKLKASTTDHDLQRCYVYYV